MDIIIIAMLQDINYTWSILTDDHSYGTMDPNEVYFLMGIGVCFLLAMVIYPMALLQSPVKYTYRRRWVKEDDLYEIIK